MSRVDYCEYLLSSQVNYTLTYFADHKDDMTHDEINRYLNRDKLRPSMLWEHAEGEVETSPNGRIVFDDTVLDKSYSEKIETSQFQYSGAEKGVVKGIGVVTCVYYNPDCNKFWVIDYRIFDKERDGKTKITHVLDMLKHTIHHKKIPFTTVLMDTWYATKKIMQTIDDLGKFFYCPIKANRGVSYTDQQYFHVPVADLEWSEKDLKFGKRVHLKDMHRYFHVKLFRISGTHRTDYVVTNDLSQNSADDVRKECAMRWKVEELHRELKQTTGIQKCQCRKQRIQRNHIACAFLVWNRLKNLAYKMHDTIYSLKRSLLENYMRSQLCSPTISMWGFA